MRRGFLIAFIFVAIALPVATRVMFPVKPAAKPIPVSTATSPSTPAPAAAVAKPAVPEPEPVFERVDPEAEPSGPTGSLNLRFDLEAPDGWFRLIVFSQAGHIDKSEQFHGAPTVKVGPIVTGKKVVLVLPGTGSYGCATLFATVVEGTESEVPVRLPKGFEIRGSVDDGSGKVVPELAVDVDLCLPIDSFGEGILGRMESMIISRGAGIGRSTYRGGSSHYSYYLHDGKILLSFGATTDSNGKFRLPLLTSQGAVALKITRDKQVLKEESVVLSSDPLRLVVPVQPPEEPKK